MKMLAASHIVLIFIIACSLREGKVDQRHAKLIVVCSWCSVSCPSAVYFRLRDVL